MGRAYPGHEVLLVDDEGQEVDDGEAGEVVTPHASPMATPAPTSTSSSAGETATTSPMPVVTAICHFADLPFPSFAICSSRLIEGIWEYFGDFEGHV